MNKPDLNEMELNGAEWNRNIVEWNEMESKSKAFKSFIKWKVLNFPCV